MFTLAIITPSMLSLFLSLFIGITPVVDEPIRLTNALSERQELVTRYAFVYNVPEETLFKVLACENPSADPTLQSGLYYTKDHPEWGVKKGEQELSFGVSQLHLPSNPNITYEQATNMDFSVRFLAKEISKGHGSRWACYAS